ncbi:hypothetical protein J5N97_021310 [Dioscorea zingiberensis]|uniref:Late embryogenesis abundant protein LEA-2 subgroup domain-containing protein n=1 Tax=Dioscorea zingiberensis TaxID=325984 RepID=A0A9D5HE45_9LILI|nr:hypothetical protein J5N97_021310 [Dioscorea zingiberensis]
MYQSPPQPHLSSNYFGPSIPPQQTYQTHQPRTFHCCLLSTAIKLFFTFCISFAFAILILWLVFRPHKLLLTADHASLTTFNLTPSSTLSHNLSALLSLQNPNKHIRVFYDWLEADAFFSSHRFSFVPLPTFFQPTRNTTTLHPTIAGTSSVPLTVTAVQDFNKAKQAGLFSIDLWLYGRIRYKFGSAVTRRYGLSAKCVLRLPLLPAINTSSSFTRTQCDVVDY